MPKLRVIGDANYHRRSNVYVLRCIHFRREIVTSVRGADHRRSRIRDNWRELFGAIECTFEQRCWTLPAAYGDHFRLCYLAHAMDTRDNKYTWRPRRPPNLPRPGGEERREGSTCLIVNKRGTYSYIANRTHRCGV